MSLLEQLRPDLKARILDHNKRVAENQEIVNIINDSGGLKTKVEPSDKLGYDWKVYLIGDTPFRWDYIKQENPLGTKENPIPWEPGLALTPNYYYTYEGVRKVWMGQEGAVANWDDGNFEEF